MKKLLFTLLTTCILLSCNQASQKGTWNNTDKELCRTEAKAEFDSEMNQLLTLGDVSLDELIDCMCSSMEENFENYEATDMATEEEAGMMLLKCMGTKFEQLMNEGLPSL